MPQPRVLILRSPGANCDEETKYAFELAGASADRIHVNRLLETPGLLGDYQILCVPGGFSYGDDIAAGRILGDKLKRQLGDVLTAFRDKGNLILGICNGFQVLMRTGLLVETDPATNEPIATLASNRHGRFECRWVHLATAAGKCAFLRADEVLFLPIAHAEGNFITRDAATLDRLASEGRVNVRYVDESGQPGPFPVNPNGSMGDVAGISDATGRVFALMPHPERHVSPYQHPRWTHRKKQPPHGDGLRIFQNAVQYLQ